MTKQIFVEKRDGRKEELNINKIHFMVDAACKDLSGVSASQIEMNSQLQFYDGMSTEDIQSILIKSASDLISLDDPNYQYAAARLLLFSLYKKVYNDFNKKSLIEIINANIAAGVYDPKILEHYTTEEIAELDSFIKHERDYNFTYSGLSQVIDKYLVQNRITKQIYETPQIMYMLIAATLFSQYPKETRLTYVKKYYNKISLFKLNLATPIIAGVRTPLRQFASCVLIDVADNLDSIYNSNTAIGKYTSQRAGIGINFGRIRAIKSQIRNGEVEHTGVIPFLKMFESTTKSCTQNGARGGSSTSNCPIWHLEIEDIIVLKNSKGTEENRVRQMDYVIQINKLFYERFLAGKNISLFSPHEVPDLYDSFISGDNETFKKIYEKAEKNPNIRKKVVSALELFTNLMKERLETGRIYIMNIDHFNNHSSFKDSLPMTNLCVEISLPTVPIKHLNDTSGEIATCILSSINVGKLSSLDELEELNDLAVRALDELIDYQGYPIQAAEISTKARRSLGIGYMGLAHYLAKHKLKYSDKEAWQLVHDLSEAHQYYLLKASNNLAKEKGKCDYFDRTKYADGILPIDTYKKDIDAIIPNKLNFDWEALRKDILEFGLRNSTLSAQMPGEASSITMNETNGIEPPRSLISVKQSKKGPLKQIVPGYATLKPYYTLLWDMEDNKGYIHIVAMMQKFFDQSISANWSYNPSQYPNGEIPMSVLIQDLLYTYKMGWKTSYYCNSDASSKSVEIKEEANMPVAVDNEICESCSI